MAVKLADEPKRFDRLEPKHKVNSIAFAKYISQLREARKVAILAKDKYDRFGILVPFEQPPKKSQESLKAKNFAKSNLSWISEQTIKRWAEKCCVQNSN